MFRGRLVGIFISPDKAVDLHPVEEVRAVPGKGLQGDRYFREQATVSTSDSRRAGQEVTLIELEAVDALRRECHIELALHETRRNLVTSNVPLNHLVGREFSIGEVTLRGIRLCEPCGHLEKLTTRGVEEGLIHRGGLRARIVTEGILRTGDTIRPRDG